MAVNRERTELRLYGSAGSELAVADSPDLDGEVVFTIEGDDHELHAWLGKEERQALIEWLVGIDAA